MMVLFIMANLLKQEKKIYHKNSVIQFLANFPMGVLKLVAITLDGVDRYYGLPADIMGATALSQPPFFIADYVRSLCKMKENGIQFIF